MNMNKNVLEHMDKAAYIILLCIAAVAAVSYTHLTLPTNSRV